MSSTTTGFTDERQPRGGQTPVSMDYIPTEEEKRVFRECNQESFWYRSVPFSVMSMALTQVLVARGSLSASPRFGSLPKVAFAGFCGYLAGKMSYMKTCQEKFKRLENSPLGEALRQRTGLPPQTSRGALSELSDPNTQSYDTMFQPADVQSQIPTQPRDSGYESNQMTETEDFSAPARLYVEEDEPRKKSILYEDLRLKNRENYEVTLTQKAESLLEPQTSKKEPQRTTKEGKQPRVWAISRVPDDLVIVSFVTVKKNIYGDAWEE